MQQHTMSFLSCLLEYFCLVLVLGRARCAASCLDSFEFGLFADMSNFRQLADFRFLCLALGHSCESSRSGLIFSIFLIIQSDRPEHPPCSGWSDCIISRFFDEYV